MSADTKITINQVVDAIDGSITSSDGYGGLSSHGKATIRELLNELMETLRAEIIAEVRKP